MIATGLSKDTDTAPRLPEVKPFTGGSTNLASNYSGPIRGGGTPAGPTRGSSGPMRGGGSLPPARGGGAPRGGGGPPPMSGRPVSVKTPSKPQCKALYDFTAEDPDELTFVTGAIIEVLSQDGDWWTGLYNGNRGLFPGTYVEVIAQMEQNALPPARGGGAPRGAPRGRGGPPRGGPPRGGPPRGGPPRGRGY